MPAMETGVTRSLLEFGKSGSLMIRAAQNAVGAVQTLMLRKEELSSRCKTDCEDALLNTAGAKTDSLRALVCLESG